MMEDALRNARFGSLLVALKLRLQSPYTGVSTPPTPEIPKKSQKGVPGPPGPECQKSVEKVPAHPFWSLFDSFSSHLGLFRHFFDTPGREARERLFETFWGFRGSGVWRLVYMAAGHATLKVMLLSGRCCSQIFDVEIESVTDVLYECAILLGLGHLWNL